MKVIYIIILSFCTITAWAQNESHLGDLSDGSRAVPVHLIQLLDEDSSVIRLEEHPLLPFSPRYTCGKCHNYEKIKHGWHFNATDTAVANGRHGIPWIYVDQQTLTQVPLSFRSWPGLLMPQRIGLTTMQFVQMFGRQMPGGGPGENQDIRERDDLFRWQVSGDLEIDCLSCHDAEFSHDQAEYAAQTARQNFRWAASAATGLAFVQGSAKLMPDNFDVYWGVAPDQPQDLPPQVYYNASRFNKKWEVFFDVTCDIPNRNCFYCHSSKIIDSTRTERWQMGEDVHLAAGMKCIDCHRNGLDHQIIRGYDGEIGKRKQEEYADYTCTGCHQPDNRRAATGRNEIAAPRPAHRGIPLIHFDRLTCTACHAGEWPLEQTRHIKTSITHGLGVKGINKSDRILPHVLSPVLAEQSDGKIAPHNMVWPSFWAYQKGDTINPIPPPAITAQLKNIVVNDDSTGSGDWLALTDSMLIGALDTLSAISGSDGQPVFISGGKIYRKNSAGKIEVKDNSIARPYLWPLAHNIRPATRSLGKSGCADCHALDAPFYWGKIEVDTPLKSAAISYRRMIDYQSSTRIQTLIFASSFLFRPWLKYLIIVTVTVIGAVMILYAFKGLAVLVKFGAGEE